MQLKERGLTLVEVLLTLTLLSVVGLLIWGVFFQGAKFSSQAVSTNHMQQELNAVTTYLTRIHQTSKNYSIDFDDDHITVTSNSLKNGQSTTETFDNNHFIYDITMDQSGEIHPNEMDVLLTVTIRDKNDKQNYVSIETILSRLKDGGGTQQ